MEQPQSFDEQRERVRQMVAGGLPLSAIEGELASARLSDEEKAALWLFAWVLSDEPPSRSPAVTARRA